ncbi:peptide-methionine (R)-S-oxide reductase [Pontibacter arcticus]|uniref:peptide-methionine (R)-S-oxide reductase n=1 Tax=Pontibacter arcticus TaxID=2080288 RepID=A0A364RIW2_9BACT|nr:peptide-methionine (R)-S-oxide reductase [Pontibacter arcticus]RAU84270.1 peptide-methionine (R)-S-oxide reductase [Pontibacter arcticus]
MPRNQKIKPLPQDLPGVYTCANCSQVLFAAKYKFSVGSGFPSFWQHVKDHVKQHPLATYGRHRIQLLCSRCNQHLGHLFEDARTPTNLRYCINADALEFNQNITL